MTKYYVTMTDQFMSGWGMAENKINKLVLECDTYTDAIVCRENAMARDEMRYINIRTTKPHYGAGYYVSWHNIQDYPDWYKPNYFKRSV